MSEYLSVGRIAKPHGIRGAVKIVPTTEDPKRFELLEEVYVETKQGMATYTIDTIQYFKQFVIIKFIEVKDMNEAELLKNTKIYIDKKDALPLEEDEYYIGDLMGLKVITEENELLGYIKEILFTGSNDVYVVKRENGLKDLLLPVIKECVLDIDIDKKQVTVRLMEGLIDN